MSGEVSVNLVGNTGGPAEYRVTPSGSSVCNFSLCVTPRRFDKQSNQWVDKPKQWFRIAVWREQAEAVAETLTDKGMRVCVSGTLSQREYEKDGVTRTSLEVEAEEVAVSLKYATAKVTKAQRSGSSTSQQSQPADDPWAGTPVNAGGFGGSQESPPF